MSDGNSKVDPIWQARIRRLNARTPAEVAAERGELPTDTGSDWEDFDGESDKRTVASWGNELGFVDVLQLRSPDGELRYAIWTGDDTTYVEAETDDDAVGPVWRFLPDGMTRSR